MFVTGVSIMFVLLGDKYVASAENKIDAAARAFNEYLAAAASEASIKDVGASNSETGRDA